MVTKQIILILFLSRVLSQILQKCQVQNQYFDITLQSCSNCQTNCNQCYGQETCKICQPSYFYDNNNGNCLSQCQQGGQQQDFFQVCIECQIENCHICEYEGTQCKQCLDGWNLSENKLSCQKQECLNSEFLYYNRESNQCTIICPEQTNNNDRSCTDLRKFSQMKTFGSRNKIKQDDINEIYYYKKIDDQTQIVIALSATSAIFYSYPGLISLNQINLLSSSYSYSFQNNNNIYLLSTDNVQKLDIEQVKVSFVYQAQNCQLFACSNSFALCYLDTNLNVFDLSNQNIIVYKIKQVIIISFLPYQFQVQPPPTPDFPIPNIPTFDPSQPPDPSDPPQPPPLPQFDSLGCIITQGIQSVQVTKQTLGLVQKDVLGETFQSQNQNQNINPTNQVFDLKNINKTVIIDPYGDIWFIDWNNITYIYKAFQSDQSLQILNCIEYDQKARLILIKADNFNGIYQSAIICANLTFNQTQNSYIFQYVNQIIK
ncbi:hypothetical protein TTHERM_00629810 (macronuclear) [Tetrahymena thermophila SB210]|uniref:Transmembrane protein n=1 Tax=Tetrahymena thermophila (strain SB210) TaxID=312017 RepID=Q241U6_TETTS|nr:hypothetical protein TTHERM_00629810 [Tetrahymena thermophila SB210]EAS02474.2 hypothetical protein TTHERM_00629810 [Tetrahymena thermophila SB210]|eukprot:XP_001022719.2 hypothetical protein TTHERM_00629810 [Tetrahymena thermophila SB210]